MKKTTLSTLLAAALFAACTAAYALAQRQSDAPAAQAPDSKTKGTDAHHPGGDGMNHADCPLMRGGETPKSQHDSHGAHDAALDERGERAMGFSQTATVHHFLLKADGGVIQVEVKDAADASNRDLVRQHLSHIARAFAAGDFDTPALVHARVPPGADAMRRLKSEIAYAYEETEAGARIRISTKNAEALAAVHAFLRFQIEDHRTGDAKAVTGGKGPRDKPEKFSLFPLSLPPPSSPPPSTSHSPLLCYHPWRMRESAESFRLMLVAGEESGDAHAASLVRSLRERAPGACFEFFGSTGARMREAGVESVLREDDLAITGLLEIARALPRFWSAYQTLKRAALVRRPDAVVLVDWPDFNLALARTLHRRGLRVIYYISPQLWAWRSHRVRQVRRDVDLMLTILPFERDWYASRGFDRVEFVGHPFAGSVAPRVTREEFRARHGLDDSGATIALLPGSRRKEFERILPVMLDAADAVLDKLPSAQFVVALSSRRTREEAERLVASHPARARLAPRIRIVQDEAREALASSDAAAVCSGTATLEAAVLNTPLVVVYKESALNWHTLGRLIDVEHFGLVNLVAGERVAPELMQDDFTGASLARELLSLLEPERNARTRERLREATARLGEGGASARAADAVINAIRRWRTEPAAPSGKE